MPIIGNMHALLSTLAAKNAGPTGPPATTTEKPAPTVLKPKKTPSAAEGKG